MAEFSINIGEAFVNAFGFTGILRYPGAQLPGGVLPKLKGYDNIPMVEEEPEDIMSLLGTPIFMPFEIQPGNYDTFLEGVKTTIPYNGFMFPAATLVDFERSKHIVKTIVQGKDGSVKELIAMDDYHINIHGFIASPPNQNVYPRDLVAAMRAICEIPAALNVTGGLFSEFGISHIVIERFTFPALEGVQNVQPFTIEAYSDEHIELILNNQFLTPNA